MIAAMIGAVLTIVGVFTPSDWLGERPLAARAVLVIAGLILAAFRPELSSLDLARIGRIVLRGH